MKRIVILSLAMILTTAVMTFAEEGLTAFTYETALEAAVSNSNQPALDDYNIRSMESALEDAREEAKKGFYGGTPQEVVERKIIKEVEPLAAEINLDVARKQKLDHEKQLKTDVYTQMMRVMLSRDKVSLKKERIALLQEKYDIDRVQFKEGVVSEADIKDEELALSIEKLELARMETAMKSDILDMKQKLHIDLSEENQIGIDYTLQKIGTVYVMPEFNLDEAVEKALAADTGVYQKQKAVEMAELKLNIAQQHLKPGNDFYDRKVYELEAAKKDLYDTKTNLEVSIRNAYNELLTARDALEVAEKRLDLENQRMQALKIKFDAGILSRRDLIDSEVKVLEQKQQVLEAICDFNVKNELLKHYLTIPE